MATFSDLTLDRASTGDSLTVSSASILGVTTSPFTVYPAAAVQLVVTTAPSSVAAGNGFSLVVAVQDPFGNLETTFAGNVNLALANDPAGDTLGGTLTEQASAGMADFSGLTLERATMDDTLRAFSSTLSAATTGPIAVAAAAATQIVVTTQPGAFVTAGSVFGLVVTAEDRFGNTDPTYTGQVTATLANGLGGTPPGGAFSVASSAGVATFADLTLTKATIGDRLQVSSGSLNATTTDPFTVVAAGATHLAVTNQPPQSVTAGNAFGKWSSRPRTSTGTPT